MLCMKNSGKNVRIFGSKVALCDFQLKIFDLKTKTGISNIQCRISKIQPCQSEVQRCQFERGRGYCRSTPGAVCNTQRGIGEGLWVVQIKRLDSTFRHPPSCSVLLLL